LVDGAPLPDDDAFDEHIVELLDEAASAVPGIAFERDNKHEAGRIHFLDDGPKITYDPTATLQSGVADARTFRTVALLHEIMHVTCDRKYVKPDWAVKDLYGRNLHVAVDLTTDDEVGDSIRTQQENIDKNFGRAISTLGADKSKIISANLRAYLLERFGYGRGLPDVHYDTVLFEVLVYMALQKAQETPTFRYLKKLSTEAAERRMERPPRATVEVSVT
jgi:hypothetical protein